MILRMSKGRNGYGGEESKKGRERRNAGGDMRKAKKVQGRGGWGKGKQRSMVGEWMLMGKGEKTEEGGYDRKRA